MKPHEKMKNSAILVKFLQDRPRLSNHYHVGALRKDGEYKLDCRPSTCLAFTKWAEKEGLMTPQEAEEERQRIKPVWEAEKAVEAAAAAARRALIEGLNDYSFAQGPAWAAYKAAEDAVVEAEASSWEPEDEE